MGVSFLCWTRTGSQAAQATSSIVCLINPSPQLVKSGWWPCLQLAPNSRPCHSPLGLSRWGKIQEVNKAAGRVGEGVGLELESQSSQSPV